MLHDIIRFAACSLFCAYRRLELKPSPQEQGTKTKTPAKGAEHSSDVLLKLPVSQSTDAHKESMDFYGFVMNLNCHKDLEAIGQLNRTIDSPGHRPRPGQDTIFIPLPTWVFGLWFFPRAKVRRGALGRVRSSRIVIPGPDFSALCFLGPLSNTSFDPYKIGPGLHEQRT